MNKLTLIVLSLPFLFSCSPSMLKMPELPELPELPNISKIVPDISLPTLFKADINQGSVLDRFSVNQLKTGMSKVEVQNLIGSPSVTDPFHNNQWDYINHSTLYEKDNINYRLTLIFEKNILKVINTSKLTSLPPLTEAEKKLEKKRLAKEKVIADQIAKAESLANAKKKAKALAEKKAAAKAKEISDKKAEDKAKVLAKKRANEAKAAAKAKEISDKKAADKAKALAKKQAGEEKEKARKANLKEGYEAYKKAEEKAKSLNGPDTPWYRFW